MAVRVGAAQAGVTVNDSPSYVPRNWMTRSVQRTPPSSVKSASKKAAKAKKATKKPTRKRKTG